MRQSRFCNLWPMSGPWHWASRAANAQTEAPDSRVHMALMKKSCQNKTKQSKTQQPEPESDQALNPTSNLQGTKVLKDITESRLWESLRTTVPVSWTNKRDFEDKSTNHTLWTSMDPDSNNFKDKKWRNTICDTDESTGNVDTERIVDDLNKRSSLKQMFKAQKETNWSACL